MDAPVNAKQDECCARTAMHANEKSGLQPWPDQVVRRAARERDSEQPRMQCKLSTDGNVLCIHVQNEMSRQRSQKGVQCVIHRPEHDVCVQQGKTRH